MIFKTIKPGANQKYSLANPNQPCVNFFSPYANPTISVIPKSLAKPSRGTPQICVLITCPLFLVQSVDVTFWGRPSLHLPRKSLHGLHWFAPRWTCPPTISLTSRTNMSSLKLSYSWRWLLVVALIVHEVYEKCTISYNLRLLYVTSWSTRITVVLYEKSWFGVR